MERVVWLTEVAERANVLQTELDELRIQRLCNGNGRRCDSFRPNGNGLKGSRCSVLGKAEQAEVAGLEFCGTPSVDGRSGVMDANEGFIPDESSL